MLINLFKLKKLPIASNASRNSFKFVNKFNYVFKIKKLIYKKKNNAGRSSKGNLIIYTKTSLLHKNLHIKINYNLRYNKLSFISNFHFIPYKNKLISLLYYANGAISYYLTSESHTLFSYVYTNKLRKIKKFANRSYFLMLSQIKKLTHISNIELLPGKNSQYCRSSGTKGRVINFDYDNYSALVELPSGLKKIFSCLSFASIGKVSLYEKRSYMNTKVGYWKKFGVKSIVRGVAMNAVDHPHGGRTKTIRYPLTPWGKTTKFK